MVWGVPPELRERRLSAMAVHLHDTGSLVPAVVRALAGVGVGHGPLHAVTIPPSCNTFITDGEAVFVKVTTGPTDHEYLVAKHLVSDRFPTPEPLTPPTTVSLGPGREVCLLPYRFHRAHATAVSAAETGHLAGLLWGARPPVSARGTHWHALLSASTRNVDGVTCEETAGLLRGLLASTADALTEYTRVRTPKSVFAHGDLHRRNTMRAESGGAMLLDWERAGVWWPEMECAKFVQTSLTEREHAAPDGSVFTERSSDVEAFLVASEEALGRPLDLDLLDLCVRFRAAGAAAYQARWGVREDRPDWFDAGVALARDGVAAAGSEPGQQVLA